MLRSEQPFSFSLLFPFLQQQQRAQNASARAHFERERKLCMSSQEAVTVSNTMAFDSTSESSSMSSSAAASGASSSQAGQSIFQCQDTPFHQIRQFWRKRVQEWYPHLFQQTYFLPSVFMNRTQHQEKEVYGQTVYVTKEASSEPPRKRCRQVSISEALDDKTQWRVLACLEQLEETQVMFVISQMQFGDYLNELAYAAATSMQPKPGDPVLKSQNKHRGDFDILIIHRRCGILACEIKAVGCNLSAQQMTEQEEAIVARKMNDAIKQMQKTSDVLHHLVSKDETRPKIRTTLMLPNITKTQLHRVLNLTNNQQLLKDLCQCMGVSHDTDPDPVTAVSQVCLTSDDLNSPGQWWQHLMSGASMDPAMTDSVYLELISRKVVEHFWLFLKEICDRQIWTDVPHPLSSVCFRFCGPATSVQVHCPIVPRLAQSSELRTLGEGVRETASRFAPVDIVLHPKQVDALNDSQRLVFVAGPPGTGKTLLLLMKGLGWLREGKHVQVVGTHVESRAASHLLYRQLELTAGTAVSPRIHIHLFDLEREEDQERAVRTLVPEARNGELYIIADEANSGGSFRDLCTELHRQVPQLHIWAASMYHVKRPSLMSSVSLREPLRTPPRITKQVQQSGYVGQGVVERYTDPPCPLPSEGPVPFIVRHANGEHRGLTYDCRQCGREVAAILKEKLNVGGTAPGNSPTPGNPPVTSPPPLCYKDVFLLTQGDDLHDTETDSSGSTSLKASGLLQGLREAGVPVSVLNSNDTSAVADVATMAMAHDQVVAANSHTVSGLERPVVVWVQGDAATVDESVGRLHAMSRSTAQLVWVKRPP